MLVSITQIRVETQHLPWDGVRHRDKLQEAYFVDVSTRQQRSKNNRQGYGQRNGVNKMTVVGQSTC